MQAPNDSSAPGPLDARLERCRRVLDELSEAGMRLVGALDPNDPALPIEAAALAFSRISRAIRLNILLDMQLDELARGGAIGNARASASSSLPAALPAEAEPATDRAERPEPSERPDLRERLDREAPDEALRLARRPLPEVVAAICKGLRLSPEETRKAQVPFAALIANDDGPDDPPALRSSGSQVTSPTRPPPADPAPRKYSALKSSLMAGTARARGLGP